MNIIKKSLLCIALTLACLSNAWALSLQDAKAQNLVGEQANGYLGAPTSSSAEVNYLITDINAKRKAEYERIANSTGTPLSTVESMAGQKAIADTLSGRYIKPSGSGWTMK